MSDATIIIVVNVVCATLLAIVGLLVRSNVVALNQKVAEQTIEIAKLYQFAVAQGAKISSDELTKTAEIDRAVMAQQKAQPDQSFNPYPPHRKPDAPR